MVSAPPLSQLYVYVTDGCNCSCRHCWIVSGPQAAPARFLDLGQAEAAIAEALPLGLQSLKWTGGEPTIHPRFADLLRIQERHDLDGSVETNGIRVDAPLARLMRQCGVSRVAVSLDGAAAVTHDAIRGVKGAHAGALRGIEALRGADYSPQIIMTLMADNIAELPDMLALADKVGAGSLKLNIVQPMLRGESVYESGRGVSLAEMLELRDWIDREAAPRHSFSIMLDLPMAFRPLPRILAEGPGERCGILGILGLLADGDYALCGIGQNVPELVFGTAGSDSLAAIWESHPMLTSLRDGISTRLQGICGRCALNQVCLGSCLAQNYYRAHDLFAAFWLCEEAEREGLFPRTRLRPDASRQAQPVTP